MTPARRRVRVIGLTFVAAATSLALMACGSSADSQGGTASAPSASASTADSAASASAGASSASPQASVEGSGEPAPPVTTNGVTVTGNKGEQPTVKVTPGEPAPTSLVVKDVYDGTGTAIQKGGVGTFNYEGVLFSDGAIFDSSWQRGQPITFGLDQVIPGWQEGLVGMKVGGRRLLIIPPDKAYGSKALQGIPPNSTLVFVVDLLDVQK